MAAHGSEGWRFEWLITWDEVWDPAFVRQWEGWMEASPDAHVFFHPALVRAWTETYRPLRRLEPRFLIGRRGEDCTVFFPLVLDRCGWKDAWLRVIRPVGYNEYDYHDPVWAGERTPTLTSSFWQALREGLNRQKMADVASVPRVREPCATEGNGFAEVNKAPFIPLSGIGSIEELLSRFSGKSRYNLRRERAQLERLGALRLRVFGQDEVQPALGVLPDFLRAHVDKWPGAYRADGFFGRLVSHGLPSGVLHVSVLEVGGKAVSWHIGFFCRRRFYYYVPAFNHEAARCSPGMVHLVKLIEDALARGATVFDLLTGEEAYKLRWTNTSTVLYGFTMRMPGLGSWVRSAGRKALRRAASVVLRRPV